MLIIVPRFKLWYTFPPLGALYIAAVIKNGDEIGVVQSAVAGADNTVWLEVENTGITFLPGMTGDAQYTGFISGDAIPSIDQPNLQGQISSGENTDNSIASQEVTTKDTAATAKNASKGFGNPFAGGTVNFTNNWMIIAYILVGLIILKIVLSSNK